jgi:predicted PolB exonuclease-like 3'-5' exonuclease
MNELQRQVWNEYQKEYRKRRTSEIREKEANFTRHKSMVDELKLELKFSRKLCKEDKIALEIVDTLEAVIAKYEVNP